MNYDMVFEGGGAKGMVFVGALRALEAAGHGSARLVGTSAGAITATLMAAGYDSAMMKEALEEEKDGEPVFATFMDSPKPDNFSDADIKNSLTQQVMDKIDLTLVPDSVEEWIDKKMIRQLMDKAIYRTMFSFVERGGLYAGDAFVEWFEKKLDAVDGIESGMTFAEFYSATGKHLSLCASNTTKKEMMVLNHRTAPNCPVVWAVRMSMSIPFAWQEVRWLDAWGQYRDQGRAGDTIVDGGVLSNFPIHLLTSNDGAVREVMGAVDPEANPTMGLLIDETLEVPDAPSPPDEGEDEDGLVNDIKKLRTIRRVTRLVNTMTDARDNANIRAHEHLICRVPAETYGTMDFDMSVERRNALVAGGESAMEAFLARA